MEENYENFMDKFETPEEFIRAEVCANRGTQNVMDKSEMIELIKPLDNCKDRRYDEMLKPELFDLLVELKGPEIYKTFEVGVQAISFRKKFGVTQYEVRKMARMGFLQVTGYVHFRMYGKDCYADTYSPYQYFTLTTDEVHEWLEAHKRKSRQE